MRLTTTAIAAATGGERLGPVAEVDGASIDSREDVQGRLFVPIVAERDGHDYIEDACRAGAAAYLTTQGDDTGRPAVQVPDTLAALLDLGRLARGRVPNRVVGITGSVGKTSTKDLLAAVLEARWTTTANRASFNNEMGVPLTLLDAPDGVEAVVVEMGARGVGHIAQLCEVARPTVGIVTAVEGAHLEQFGSLAQVARAKGELIESLPQDGFAVLNADHPLVAAMAARSPAPVIRYGLDAPAVEVTAESVQVDDELRTSFALRSSWGSCEIRLAARGRHQVSNALAAAAAGLALGVPLDDLPEAFAGAALSPMRMDVRRRGDGLLLVDDSYNANPSSTAAALRALAELPSARRVAVLGVMAELGPGSDAAHREVMALAASLDIQVVAVGTDAYGADVVSVADHRGALDALAEAGLGAGDVVLVKGSRVAGLEHVARALLADGAPT